MLNVRRDCKIIYKAHCSRNNSIHKISLCINVHRDCKIIHKAVEEPRLCLCILRATFFQTIFWKHVILWQSIFIGGGNQSSQRKQPNCSK